MRWLFLLLVVFGAYALFGLLWGVALGVTGWGERLLWRYGAVASALPAMLVGGAAGGAFMSWLATNDRRAGSGG